MLHFSEEPRRNARFFYLSEYFIIIDFFPNLFNKTGENSTNRKYFILLKEHVMERKKVIPDKEIEQRILMIRGQKVMLSTELAELYGIEPKVLIEAVKRNIERFPENFMFQLTNQEVVNLKSQIVSSCWGGFQQATPYAFTEQGVAMLSSVLRRKRAVQVNIEFKVVFDAIRQLKTPPESSRKKIDFQVKEKGAVYKTKRGGRKGGILQ